MATGHSASPGQTDDGYGATDWEDVTDPAADQIAQLRDLLVEIAQGILVAHGRIDEMETRLAANCRTAASNGAKDATEAGIEAAKRAFSIAESSLATSTQSVSALETLSRQATAGLQKATKVTEDMEPRITAACTRAITEPVAAFRQHADKVSDLRAKEASGQLAEVARSVKQDIAATRKIVDLCQTSSRAAQDLQQLVDKLSVIDNHLDACKASLSAHIHRVDANLAQALRDASAHAEERLEQRIRKAETRLARQQRAMAALLSFWVVAAVIAVLLTEHVATTYYAFMVFIASLIWIYIFTWHVSRCDDGVQSQ